MKLCANQSDAKRIRAHLQKFLMRHSSVRNYHQYLQNKKNSFNCCLKSRSQEARSSRLNQPATLKARVPYVDNLQRGMVRLLVVEDRCPPPHFYNFGFESQPHSAAEIRAAQIRWIIIFVGSLRASSDSGGNCVPDPSKQAGRAARRPGWSADPPQIKARRRHASCGWSSVTWRAVHLPAHLGSRRISSTETFW